MSDDMPEPLHECPYCSGDDIKLDTTIGDLFMYCNSCGVSGPRHNNSPAEAYEKWQELTVILNPVGIETDDSDDEEWED